jgi:CHAT domain-containing protein
MAHIKLGDDDLLLDEVARLELDGALVVLAACDGSASDVLPGDEVLSLSHAFLAAGASDVVASVWSVYDKAIQELLVLFYKELTSGKDAPTALAFAQRTFCMQYISDNPAEEYSPVVWGGLTVIGAGVVSGL